MQALFSFILKLVGMEGFEPTQAEPPVLQTGPIHHHWSIPYLPILRTLNSAIKDSATATFLVVNSA